VNCTVLQRRLLSCDQPDQPDAELQNHLAACPSCLAWQRRLVELERDICRLPVPPSNGKANLLHRILDSHSDRPLIADPETLRLATLTESPKERGFRKLAVAFALAASLLVFAFAWWMWPHDPRSRVDPIRQEQARLEERLALSLQQTTPKERMIRLSKLAEEVHVEARGMVENNERLQRWAQFYARIVGEQMLEQARQVPAEDRPLVFESVAARLRDTESQASRFAAQLKGVAPRSAESFTQIALASRKGELDLRALLNG
jgi:hypothetical protein